MAPREHFKARDLRYPSDEQWYRSCNNTGTKMYNKAARPYDEDPELRKKYAEETDYQNAYKTAMKVTGETYRAAIEADTAKAAKTGLSLEEWLAEDERQRNETEDAKNQKALADIEAAKKGDEKDGKVKAEAKTEVEVEVKKEGNWSEVNIEKEGNRKDGKSKAEEETEAKVKQEAEMDVKKEPELKVKKEEDEDN